MDKAWKKKLKEMLPGSNPKQAEIYAFLSTLRIEMNEANFRKMLTEFNEYLKVACPTFCDYFMNTYVKDNKVQLWPACFRQGCAANTNMDAEAFHRVLKDIYIYLFFFQQKT